MKLFSSNDRDEPQSRTDREHRRGPLSDAPRQRRHRLRHRSIEPDHEDDDGADEEPLGESSSGRRKPEGELRGDPVHRQSNGHGSAPARGGDDERAEYGSESDRRGRNGHVSAENRRPRIPGPRAIRLAREYAIELTGEEPEAISGLSFKDGRWKVVLDVVELRRVPPTTDVLGTYELELDENGGLLGYRRLSRFYRSQVDEG